MATTAEGLFQNPVAEVEDVSPLEQNNSTGTAQETEGTNAVAVTTSQWKKVPIVMTLITYIFLYAGVSMIAPFYPIEVSTKLFLILLPDPFQKGLF